MQSEIYTRHSQAGIDAHIDTYITTMSVDIFLIITVKHPYSNNLEFEYDMRITLSANNLKLQSLS